MTMYVVMGNDFPQCVFTDPQKADDYCALKNAEDRKRREKERGRIIYWRAYEVQWEDAPK